MTLSILRLGPVARVSVGLVALLASLFLGLDLLFKLIPDNTSLIQQLRQRTSESLSAQLTVLIAAGDWKAAQNTLNKVLAHDAQVLSAAVRQKDGRLRVQAGEHVQHWIPATDGQSTFNQVQVPLYEGQQHWGDVEVRFRSTMPHTIAGWLQHPTVVLFGIMMLAAFAVFYLYLRRALEHLNPSAAIPERVRAAFDTLTEGVMVLDTQGRIMLANAAFRRWIGAGADELFGKTASTLPWVQAALPVDTREHPWMRALGQRETVRDVPVVIPQGNADPVKSLVTCAPILDGGGGVRGCLVSFNDVTELHRSHEKLAAAVLDLTESRSKIERQNEELVHLATRDPLTGCLNRRAFFAIATPEIDRTRTAGATLCCVMCDIDKFKLFNDNYGHAVGDQVIQSMVRSLNRKLRPTDVLCRYGGEEFCVILPGQSEAQGAIAAERLRAEIEEHAGASIRVITGLKITSSFGVAALAADVANIEVLIERADAALYEAKRSGRNRVITWGNMPKDAGHAEDKPGAAEPPSPAPAVEGQVTHKAKVQDRDQDNGREAEAAQAKAVLLSASQIDAMRDALTGIASRALLLDRLQHAIAHARRHDRVVAALALNIDKFKYVNESLGHEAGDDLLKQIARRLSATLRGDDTVARIGADSFAVALFDLDNRECASQAVTRLLRAVQEPFTLNEQEISVECSIGCAVYPQDNDDPATLLRHADTALRQAREQGGNCLQFYTEAGGGAAGDRFQLLAGLRQAAGRGELLLQYQPQKDLRNGAVSGVEALVRWKHPQQGLVPPGRFIPLAEDSDLIIQIGDWVLSEACRETRVLLDEGFVVGRVAVNLSARQFRDPRLVERIGEILKRNRLEARYLELEITESVLIRDVESVAEKLNALKALGLSLSLDDFGTGYSSLSYLKRFPIDRLKIDQTFTREIGVAPDTDAIVGGIINLGHSLGLRVVAEGVETQAQKDFLRDNGCDEMQGYLYSRPVDPPQLRTLLQRH